MRDDTPELAKATLAGLLWLCLQSLGARVVSIFTQLFLAKLLMPADFGVISIVYIITGIAATVTDFGVEGVILQRHNSFRLWTTSAFWASFGLGTVGFIIVASLGPVFAHLYHSPDIIRLAPILALSLPFGALSTLPAIQMRGDLNFRFPALYNTAENILLQASTILLAYAGFGPFSFVIPAPVFSLIKALVFWSRSPVRLSGRLRKIQLRYLVANGASVFGSQLIIQLIGQGDYATLGLFASHETVGFYYFAFRLAAQPVWMLAGNFTNVLFPALVQIKNDPARQVSAAMKAAQLLSYLIMPVCFAQAMVAKPALTLFFGHKWDASIPIVRLLSIGIAFDAATWVGGCILNARREFKRAFRITLITLPPFLLLVLIGSATHGAIGTAVGVATYYMLLGPIYSLSVFRSFGASGRDVAELYLWAPLISGSAMGVAFAVCSGISSNPLQLAAMLITGSLLYLTFMYVLKRNTLLQIVEKTGIAKIFNIITKVIHKWQKPVSL